MPRFEQTSCSHCGREFGPGDHGFSHCDQHPGPARDRLIAAAGLLLQAAKTHLMWIDREREGPLYPAGMKRDDPGGEKVWREWWEDQLDLCARTESQCREAVAAATGELETA